MHAQYHPLNFHTPALRRAHNIARKHTHTFTHTNTPDAPHACAPELMQTHTHTSSLHTHTHAMHTHTHTHTHLHYVSLLLIRSLHISSIPHTPAAHTPAPAEFMRPPRSRVGRSVIRLAGAPPTPVCVCKKECVRASGAEAYDATIVARRA
jgi:hypothetical protein